jgi:predicted dinucleotide-binding enzyme
MKHLADLDFALNRAQRLRRRKAVFVALGLIFGLQLGAAAWRWQSLENDRSVLQARQRQLEGKSTRSNLVALTAEQTKLASSAQAMINGLAVPWDSLLQAIETARPPRVVVDVITPHSADGVVSISVSSPDFASVAELVQGLMMQESLHDVMLASEALPDNVGILRAVVTAHWTSAP